MSARVSVPPANLLARLKSGRSLAGIAIAVLLLGGGGYVYFNHSPDTASAFVPKPVPATVKHTSSSTREPAAKNQSTLTVTPSTRPSAAENAIVLTDAMIDHLGAVYVDAEHGFSIRLPRGWPLRTFAAEPWILDCGDPNSAVLSIGFSPCPANVTADRLLPEGIAQNQAHAQYQAARTGPRRSADTRRSGSRPAVRSP